LIFDLANVTVNLFSVYFIAGGDLEMTKAEWIEKVIANTKIEISKANLQKIMDEAFDLIKKTIKKESRFQVAGFGTFSVKKRKARTGRNPKTGDAIKIKASKTVGFKPAKEFKESL
jgi:DNA-binding protein HU-beta